MAVQNFKNRGYASLGGIILNRRNVKREEEKVQELAEDFQTTIIGNFPIAIWSQMQKNREKP